MVLWHDIRGTKFAIVIPDIIAVCHCGMAIKLAADQAEDKIGLGQVNRYWILALLY